MDEIMSGAVLLTLIMVLIAFGFIILVAIAVAAGIVALFYYGGRAILREVIRVRQEIQEERKRAAERQAIREKEMRDEAKRQEILQQHLKETQAALEREEKRRQEEAVARERLETERQQATSTVLGWNQGLFVKAPSPEDINTMVEQSCRIQSHTGRYLMVTAAMGKRGIALEWKAHMAGTVVPQIIGHCDRAIMFSEWAFAGRHSSMLSPGRHVLVFFVNRGGSDDSHEDLSFEVFVSEESATRQAFKDRVEATAKDFVEQAQTVANAKRHVRETLETQRADPEEIEAELGRFEGQIHSLTEE